MGGFSANTLYNYYAKVVPTEYLFISGKMVDTNQYSVTHNEQAGRQDCIYLHTICACYFILVSSYFHLISLQAPIRCCQAFISFTIFLLFKLCTRNFRKACLIFLLKYARSWAVFLRSQACLIGLCTT